MPCAKLPLPVIPTLPAGITIPIPPLPIIPHLTLPCCNIPVPPFPIVTPALPIGIVLTSAQLAALMADLNLVQAYFDAFSINCPIE